MACVSMSLYERVDCRSWHFPQCTWFSFPFRFLSSLARCYCCLFSCLVWPLHQYFLLPCPLLDDLWPCSAHFHSVCLLRCIQSVGFAQQQLRFSPLSRHHHLRPACARVKPQAPLKVTPLNRRLVSWLCRARLSASNVAVLWTSG